MQKAAMSNCKQVVYYDRRSIDALKKQEHFSERNCEDGQLQSERPNRKSVAE